MSIFKRKSAVAATMTADSGTSNADVSSFLTADAGMHSYSEQMLQGYAGNPYVYRAANLVAQTIAGIRPMLLDRDDNEVPADADPALAELMRRPNARQTWRSLIADIAMDRVLNGNAFVYAVSAGQRVKELDEIPRKNITAVPTGNIFSPVKAWTISTGTGTVTAAPEDVIHIHSFQGNDSVYGVSPLEAASASIAQQNNARTWNASLTENGAKPSLCVSTPRQMTAERFDELRSRMRAGFSGPSKAGSFMLLDDGKTVTQLGYTPLDMDYSAGMTVAAREIVLAMGVPPELAGDSANKTYSNAQEANRELVDHTIRPLITEIYEALSQALIGSGRGRIVRLSYDSAPLSDMRGDFATTITAVQGASYLTANEKRALLSYPSVPGGDTVLQPMGQVPIGELSTPLPAVPDNTQTTTDTVDGRQE